MATATEGGIRRLDALVATYAEFAGIMMANHPAILYNFEQLLPSFRRWQREGKADIDFLRQAFGSMVVPVVECSSEGYGDERQTSMTLREYLDAVQDGRQCQESGDDDSGGAVLYLKDWHFQRIRRDEGENANLAEGAETPFFFADDWLNWWWERKAFLILFDGRRFVERLLYLELHTHIHVMAYTDGECDHQGQEDYRFVYIGPRGSWTPLHHDVLSSYSWSYNVCGRKHWTLFPQEATPCLYDRLGRNLATDVRKDSLDSENFPQLKSAPRLEVVQGPGEAVFVPSGWHHQVVNLGDEGPHGGLTISVNNNWFNGFSLDSVRSFLSSELAAVREALDHLRLDMTADGEWERQCELVMRTNSGLNVTDFAQMVMARALLLLSGNQLSRDPRATLERTRRTDGDGHTEGSVAKDTESGSRENRDDGSRGVDLGAWHEERWTAFTLEKIAPALRDLSTPPFANHIFFNDAHRSGDTGFDTPGEEIGDDLGESSCSRDSTSVREALACVERYLRCTPDPKED